MPPVCVTVVLTAVVLAQADPMSDLLHLPAHKDHLYLLDVTSDASVGDLKAAVVNFTLGGSYKVIGEGRFFFLFGSSDLDALRTLTFPAGSAVTQHAVENVDEYLDMFRTGLGLQEDNTDTKSLDTVMLFFEIGKKFPDTACSKAFEMEVEEWANTMKKAFNTAKAKIYPVIAQYPPKRLEFVEIEENALQTMLKTSVPTLGGYGQFYSSVKRIVQI